MGKVRKIVTTVLVAGALVPALTPGSFFNGGSTAPIAAIDAFRRLPTISVDKTKLDDFEIARASLGAYNRTVDNKFDKSERAKASVAAFHADPTVKAADAEVERAMKIYFRRGIINIQRLRVLISAMLLVTVLAVTSGWHRFRNGSKRSGAVLLAAGIAVAPLAIRDSNGATPTVRGASLFARTPVAPPLAGDWKWRTPKPAPAGEVWSAAAIDKTRAIAHPTWSTQVFADEGLIPTKYDDASRWAVLVPSIVGALLVLLAALLAAPVLRQLRRLVSWTPSFRRHFPTLWPVRTPLA
jgi:hypothetical protein